MKLSDCWRCGDTRIVHGLYGYGPWTCPACWPRYEADATVLPGWSRPTFVRVLKWSPAMSGFCLVKCLSTKREYVFPRHQLRVISKYNKEL